MMRRSCHEDKLSAQIRIVLSKTPNNEDNDDMMIIIGQYVDHHKRSR